MTSRFVPDPDKVKKATFLSVLPLSTLFSFFWNSLFNSLTPPAKVLGFQESLISPIDPVPRRQDQGLPTRILPANRAPPSPG